MPVKNSSKYLESCLKSIQNQEEKDWELLAINDHSSDKSLEILHHFAQNDARIKVFQNSGKGIIPALQLAFQESSGDLISRMDSDDLMEKNKLSELKKMAIQFGKGFVYTNLVKYFSDEELGNGYQKYENWLNQTLLSENPFQEIYKECVVPSPSWLLFRSDLIKCDGFNSNIYPEDYDLCFRYYQQKFKIKTVPKVLHFWRDYPERTSRNDSNYANPNYLDLKINYFFQLDFDKNLPLVLWGLGKKGKHIAKKIQTKNQDFIWICNNPNKIGKEIYGVLIQSYLQITEIPNVQILILVSSPDEQKEIQLFLNKYKINNYYFFC